jgi:hypothetical protein
MDPIGYASVKNVLKLILMKAMIEIEEMSDEEIQKFVDEEEARSVWLQKQQEDG